jgi:outer membrane protein assembly factor BamB
MKYSENKLIWQFIVVAVMFLAIGYFFGTRNIITNTDSPEIKVNENDSDNNSINQILDSSGVLSANIYNPDKNLTEFEEARGKKLEVPNDYEEALDIKYPVNNEAGYNIKIFRQINKTSNEEDSDMPEKPLIVAIVKDNDIVVNLFVINTYSVLEGSMCWGDNDKTKVAGAAELKDLDGDGISEILVHTFKCYTADSEEGLVTLYHDVKNNIFIAADKIFVTTWKQAFELTEINKKYYVLEANSGSGSCRVCPTPYLVRIYSFNGDYFFDIGSVGVEKEYDEGTRAIKHAFPRIKEKILTGDVFTL